MKRVLLIMALAVSVFCVNAQNNPWKRVNLTSTVSKGKDVFQKHFKPSAYVTFQLNEAALKATLRKAPTEKTSSASTSSLVISVPNSKGQIERFRVVEAPSMEAGLAAAHPNIKSYSGQGVNNPGSRIRFDISPLGFHASIMSADRKTFYVSCVDKASKSYIVYEREILDAKKYNFDCLLDESVNTEIQGKRFSGITDKNANTNTLRIYKLALNLTGEFSRAVLADVAPGTDTSTVALKKAIVLSLANSITTEANTYFENEMNLRLVLINTETSIIYLDPATDPFSTWTTSFVTTTWNTETQTNCTNVIGTVNYDIGHMLTYNTEKNNGNAGCIGCVCKTPSGSIGKGRGWNMYGEYQGYYFVVDYWTHEMGHQFGGNHTFSHNYEGSGVQIEPGSGTTIMAYAGITGATDVQSHSDPFFHSKTIQQITDYIQTGTGNTCGTTLALTNSLPTANGGSDYTIPKSTPFTLTGSSTDADGADVPTYSWEQIDSYVSGGTSNTYPTATSTTGPMFRFFPPVTSLSRTFPRLQVILDSNNTGKWEVLPSVARSLNFRFIVRDNHNGMSANESDDVLVTVGSAGPFAVTAPNTAVSLTAGSSQTITWSVNSTNTATYATNVKLSMSIDGGQTFPYVLAASTPNDGTETITVPNVASGACRVKVEAVGNIFFDISNVNFAVGACGTPIGLTASSVTATSATVSWTAVTGATSYDVDYRVIGAGSWTTGVAATASTSLNLTGLTQGTDYEFRVKTNCSFNNGQFTSIPFTTLCSVAPTGLSASAITNSTATLNWSAASGAASYKVDYKLTTESIWVRATNATTATSINIFNLIPGKTYDYRVRSNCASLLSYSGY
ncbi:MAG: reprolysin-like metallopeptidase, partial [Panacibacter sp.]